MPRLALIQAEIRAAKHRLEDLRADGRANPSQWGDIQPAREVLRLRLAELRRQEIIILNGRSKAKEWVDPAPFRKNAEVEDQDVSMIVYLMLVVAIVGVSVAMLMAAAGVISQ
jgi:hypothetical protein